MTSPDSDSPVFFEVRDEQPDYFLAPDGKRFNKIWWDEPVRPQKRLPIGLAEKLLQQIDETGGKQSCWLTAQLNAWTLRGLLAPTEADHVQDVVRYGSQFQSYWRDQAPMGRNFVAWTSRAGDTAYAVSQITGKRMAFAINYTTEDFEDHLPEILDQGFVVVLNDDKHSRTAFQPEGSEQIFVYDPKYPDATGLYDLSGALGLQTNSHFLVA